MLLRISSALVERLRALASETSEREICGLLVGSGNDVFAIEPARNIATDPAVAFAIDPRVVIAARKRAREGGLALVGHYHSHPSGDGRPSARDAEQALDEGAIWLIVAAGTVSGWVARRGGQLHGRFNPLDLLVTS